MPREQQLHHAADQLLRVSPEGLYRYEQSAARVIGIPDDLRYMPLDHLVGRRAIRSHKDDVPVDRGPHQRGLRIVPCEQQLPAAADQLLWMPPEGLYRNQ